MWNVYNYWLYNPRRVWANGLILGYPDYELNTSALHPTIWSLIEFTRSQMGCFRSGLIWLMREKCFEKCVSYLTDAKHEPCHLLLINTTETSKMLRQADTLENKYLIFPYDGCPSKLYPFQDISGVTPSKCSSNRTMADFLPTPFHSVYPNLSHSCPKVINEFQFQIQSNFVD